MTPAVGGRIVALIAALVTASACAAGPGRGGQGARAAVTDRVDLPASYRFSPPSITVPAGTTVTWTNSDRFTHSVRLLDGERVVGVMEPGQEAAHRFDAPGRYRYDCHLHPRDMRGEVIVTASP